MKSAAVHGLDLAAQTVEHAAVDAREQAPIAPLRRRRRSVGQLGGTKRPRSTAPSISTRASAASTSDAARPRRRRDADRPSSARASARCARTISMSAPSRSVQVGARRAGGSTTSGTKRRVGQIGDGQRAALGGDPERTRDRRARGARSAPRRDERARRASSQPRASARRPRAARRASSSRSCSSSAIARRRAAPRRPPAAMALGIEPADPLDDLGRQPAPHGDRARAALLERRVVEERVRVGVQDLVREHRRLGQLARDRLRSRPSRIASSSAREALGVHRLDQAVAHASRARADGRAARWRRRRGCPGRRSARGRPPRSDPARACAGCGGGTRLPPWLRSSASERVAFQRQRVSNIGACSGGLREQLLDVRRRAASRTPSRAGSCAAGRARARCRRRSPPPAARSRTSGRSACAAPCPRRG